jgi:hypothetical protein
MMLARQEFLSAGDDSEVVFLIAGQPEWTDHFHLGGSTLKTLFGLMLDICGVMSDAGLMSGFKWELIRGSWPRGLVATRI